MAKNTRTAKVNRLSTILDAYPLDPQWVGKTEEEIMAIVESEVQAYRQEKSAGQLLKA